MSMDPLTQIKHVVVLMLENLMNYFAAGRLQVLHPLAGQFCICDNWFCDGPTCTVPNRLFTHSATSEGILSGGLPQSPLLFSFR